MTREELLKARNESLSLYSKREKELVEHTGSSRLFGVYQVRDEKSHEYAFLSLAMLNKEGKYPSYDNYQLVYLLEGVEVLNRLNQNEALEEVFCRFNRGNNVEKGFFGHSISVGDVIVISEGDNISAWFCDDLGFKEIPAFADNILKNNNGYLIKIGYSWGEEESDLIVKNFDIAWKTMKKMVIDEIETVTEEHDCFSMVRVDKEKKEILLRYTYDDTWALYKAVPY